MMHIKNWFKTELRYKNRQKVITMCYALAIGVAFVLSLTNNNAVKASVSPEDEASYLLIENNVINNLASTATIYPKDAVNNINSLFALVNDLVQQKEVDKQVVVQSGDTLISALERFGISHNEANTFYKLLQNKFDPRSLKAGQKLTAVAVVDNRTQKVVRLNSLIFSPTEGLHYIISQNDAGVYQLSESKDELIEEINSAAGSIEGTLSASMNSQGIPNRIVHNFISVFAYAVDFRRDVRRGDKFEIIYENYLDTDGKTVKSGDILYAALILRNDKISMYRFKRADGTVDFYTEKGQALKKTLDRKPLAFKNARISSPFGKRYHPILHKYKIHWGVDYAAPKGTHVFAGGDGVVQVAKYNGSYGNYIKIRHNSEFSTAYGHMSGFAKGIRPGVRVKQGQLIGYVGSTGRSTGPHLHYEVVQNGRRVNPRTIRASTGENLAGRDLANFKKMVANLHTSYKSVFAAKESQKMARK